MKKRIHFVGIKGVGMTPLAIIAKQAGMSVSGCDIAEEFITDVPLRRAGIVSLNGFTPDHIKNVDVVITTGAHGGFDNIEVQTAKALRIPILTQGQAIGEFQSGAFFGKSLTGISVAGSHGKTTTTAMLATILQEAGFDPSYLIGTSGVPSLAGPGHFGKGRFFIAEADEYATEPVYDKTPKLFWQKPKIAIITNIELDHPDLYPTLDAITEAFITFARAIPQNGLLIVCGDDLQVNKLLKKYTGNKMTYGYADDNDFVLSRVHTIGEQTFFDIQARDRLLGTFAIHVAGEHNALNATAAILAAMEAGVPFNRIAKVIGKFCGSKRRAEYIGKLATGALLFDDYAHHPTEIRKTLRAFREWFPKKKLICIFQPHTYSRTKILFEQFIRSFFDADTVILIDLYPSLRETPDPTVSSARLVEAIKGIHSNAFFFPHLSDVVQYINQQGFHSDTVVITMGAGDVYKINKKLKMKNEK